MITNGFDYKAWVSSLANVGIKPMSDDTAARLLAIVYIYAGSMEFIYNKKLLADIEYAQAVANIGGAEIPNAKITEAMKGYIKDIENVLSSKEPADNSDNPLDIKHPEWVCEFMKEHYGINKMLI